MDESHSTPFARWSRARLREPAMRLTDAKRHAFDALIETRRCQGAAQPVVYRGPYPTYEFLSYLVAERGYLLHGSRERHISRFEPRPASDVAPFSAQHAVYAASDGIWPIVFAIRDRRPQQGTFINGCSRVLRDDGSLTAAYYHFALAAAGLRERPWTSGTIYVLPRESFVPHPLVREHGLTVTLEEWASTEPVVPVARVEVGPADFPFLGDVWGYDPELLGGRYAWTDLDHADRRLFPIRPRHPRLDTSL